MAQQLRSLPAMQETQETRSSGEGNGIPLQYSCLENPIKRGAWEVTVYRVPVRLDRPKHMLRLKMDYFCGPTDLLLLLSKSPIKQRLT